MMRTRLPIFSTAIVLIILFPSLLTPIAATAQGERIPRIGGHTEGGGAVIDGQYGDHESDRACSIVCVSVFLFERIDA